MELQAEQRLLHYRLISRLGAGGGGEVWEADDEKLGRRVALKVPPAEVAEDARAMARFEREAWALAQLSHPGVVRVLAIEEAGARRFLVLELIEGLDLAAVLAGEGARLSAERLAEIGAAVASALRAAHAAGVIHRDLTPANVMLTTDGTVKVIDFGIARLTEASVPPDTAPPRAGTITRHGTVMGTTPYMAPEQVRGRPADARTDLFALGLLLFEAASGQRAFDGPTDADVFAAILKSPAPDLSALRPDLPPELSAIVARCLAKEPDRRFRSAREVEEALLAILRRLPSGERGEAPARPGAFRPTEEVPLAGPGTAARRAVTGARRALTVTGDRIRRHPVLATAGAFGLLVALTLLTAFWPGARVDPALHGDEALAVLPFAEERHDPDLAYLGEGLTAGFASRLDELSRFRVLGHVESKRAFEAVGDPAAAALRLGAARILEGEIRHRQDRVEVAVRLRDGRSGDVLWADEAFAPREELLDLQRDLSRRIARTLAGERLTRAELASLESDPTSSYEAYDFYLQGLDWLERVTTKQYDRFAATLFRQAIDADPGFALAQVGLSDALWIGYHLRNEPSLLDDARRAAERALELQPGLAEAHAALAKVQRNSGEVREAIRSLESVLPDHERRDRVYRELALTFERFDRPEDAESCLRLAAAMGRDDWRNWNALASFLVRRGNYAEAREAFGEAAARAPAEVTWPRQNLVSLDLLEGRFEQAIAGYEAIPGVEEDAGFESNLGTAYFYLERWPEAERHYREAVRLAPDRPVLHRNLGDVLERTGRTEEAREEFRRARDLLAPRIDQDPTDPSLRVDHALMSAKAGECDEAAPRARELGESAPAVARTWHHLAATFALCDHREEALDAARRAIDLGYSLDLMLEEDELRSVHPFLRDAASPPVGTGGSVIPAGPE